MKKTLYSLILSEDVVREVDTLAYSTGTNRSALINQILADYFSITTPERRINGIFRAIEEMLAPSRGLIPFISPNALTMSLKSSLEYKYRPTVKYEVELYRSGGDSIGELSVIFRTQSSSLIEAMGGFFRIFKEAEDRYLAPRLKRDVSYALYEGRFVRSISAPSGCDCAGEELAMAISSYIRLFDDLMKGYLAGKFSAEDIGSQYRSHVENETILI